MSITLGIHAFLALLLLRAAAHKLLQHQVFRGELRAYRLLPEVLLPIAPFLLALTEVLCIVSLPAIALLLSLYSCAMLVNLLRGNVQIDCGCNGWLSPRKQLDYWLLLRNVVLVGLALFADQISAVRSAGTSAEIAIGILICTALLLLYEGAEQAISNGQRHRQWLQRRSEATA